MTRSELIDALVADQGITRAEADGALTAITERIVRALEDGDRVRWSGFGSFFSKQYRAYVAHNPRTDGKVDIPSKRLVRFKAHRGMNLRINEGSPNENYKV